MPFLIAIGGPKRNIVHPVHAPGCKVGRGLVSTKHLSIERDEYISRRGASEPSRSATPAEVGHAEFAFEAGAWLVRDLASQNSVLVVVAGTIFQLMEGGTKPLPKYALIECGQTILLWMDVQDRPPEAFVQALSRDPGPVIPSAAASHTGVRQAKSTGVIDDPRSEVPVLKALWTRVSELLEAHGYR